MGDNHHHCCSRRQLLGAGASTLAASLLAGPGLSATAHPTGFQGKIDVHHHFLPQDYMKEEQKGRAITHGATAPSRLTSWDASQSIDLMDKNGIARAIGSISMPGVWSGDVPTARRLSRVWNEAAARVVQAHPTRFGFFAVVAPPDTDGALKEIAYALDTLKADGIALVTNYDGKLLGDSAFRPVLEELHRRKAIVYVHPTVSPCCAATIPGLIPQIIEFPADTTRTITSLLMNGALTEFGGIRWIFSHGGGTLPFMAARIEEIARFKPEIAARHPDGIQGQLKLIYCDTASAYSRAQLAAMTAFYPPSHMLFGSDFPFVPAVEGIEGIDHYPMTRQLRSDIYRNNALKLWPGIKPA